VVSLVLLLLSFLCFLILVIDIPLKVNLLALGLMFWVSSILASNIGAVLSHFGR
jgi:hypothetical protein